MWGESLQTPRPCPPSPGCLLPTQVLRCRPGLSGDPLWPSVLQVGKSVSLNVGPTVAPVNRGRGRGEVRGLAGLTAGGRVLRGTRAWSPGALTPATAPSTANTVSKGWGLYPTSPQSTQGERQGGEDGSGGLERCWEGAHCRAKPAAIPHMMPHGTCRTASGTSRKGHLLSFLWPPHRAARAATAPAVISDPEQVREGWKDHGSSKRHKAGREGGSGLPGTPLSS